MCFFRREDRYVCGDRTAGEVLVLRSVISYFSATRARAIRCTELLRKKYIPVGEKSKHARGTTGKSRENKVNRANRDSSATVLDYTYR